MPACAILLWPLPQPNGLCLHVPMVAILSAAALMSPSESPKKLDADGQACQLLHQPCLLIPARRIAAGQIDCEQTCMLPSNHLCHVFRADLALN